MPTELSDLDTRAIWERAEVLERDPHLIEQVNRLLDPLRLVCGTREMPDTPSLIHQAALGVAILEHSTSQGVEAPNPISGPIMVAYNPLSGYDLLVRASTVYKYHLDLPKGHRDA